MAHATKDEAFTDRVRRLRDARGWSQNELAERAELAPAALSRILAGDREPRMGHLIALAAALELTLTDLVAGTTAASAVLDWVPRERFEEAGQGRIDALRERDIARSDLAARVAEVESLKKTAGEMNRRLVDTERELAHARGELEMARQQRKELEELRGRAAALEALRPRLEAQVSQLTQALNTSRLEAADYYRKWEEAYGRSRQLQAEVATAKGGQVAVGVVGLFLGAVLNADPPRRRRS